MNVEHDDDDLKRMEFDKTFTGGRGDAVVKGFRKTMQHIRAAMDERDLYASQGRRFEKLHGKREGQHSFRINDQWRLIVEIRGKMPPKTIGVIEIADYH